MISLTKLNNSLVVVNCDLILTVESTPDTLITFTNGKQIVVREKVEEIVERIIDYRIKLEKKKVAIDG